MQKSQRKQAKSRSCLQIIAQPKGLKLHHPVIQCHLVVVQALLAIYKLYGMSISSKNATSVTKRGSVNQTTPPS